MAGILTVDTIQSDSSYASTLNVASKINFTSGMQIGGQDTTFGGMRNRIINGAMTIDQKKAGAVLTDSEFTNKPACMDLWYLALGNGATGTTAQQVSDAPTGFTNSLKWTGRTSSTTLGAGNWDAILTSIEGYNIADFGWGTSAATPITISFWVKGSISATMSLSVYNGGSGDNAPAASASVTRCYVTNYTINTPNTWEYKTITIPAITTGTWGSTNGIGLTLYFNLNSGSNYTGTVTNAWQTVSGSAYVQTSATATNYMALGGNKTFQLTGVQVEKGSSATPFEYRHFQQELGLCMRYFEKSYDLGTAVGSSTTDNGPGALAFYTSITGATLSAMGGTVYFKVAKRSIPTVTIYSTGSGGSVQTGKVHPSGGSDVTCTVTNLGQNSMFLYTSQGNYYWQQTINAEL